MSSSGMHSWGRGAERTKNKQTIKIIWDCNIATQEMRSNEIESNLPEGFRKDGQGTSFWAET